MKHTHPPDDPKADEKHSPAELAFQPDKARLSQHIAMEKQAMKMLMHTRCSLMKQPAAAAPCAVIHLLLHPLYH